MRDATGSDSARGIRGMEGGISVGEEYEGWKRC